MAKASVKHSLLLNIILALGSLIVALLVVEVVLRFFFIKDFGTEFYLFISKPALQDQETNFGFTENTEIREVALFRDGSQFKAEYDNTFTTNNVGLVQKKPFDPKKEAIVLIGDSFTQGVGAPPWFYQLEENWQSNSYQLVNLGMLGTGMEQWRDMLEWFNKKGKIRHIFICFIANDWERMRWVPREDPAANGFKFVPWEQRHDMVHNQQLTVYYMDKDDGIERLGDGISKKKPADNYFKSFRIIKKLLIDRKLYYNSPEEIFASNKAAFEEIVATYGAENVTFFHIPEKSEAISGAYSPLSEKIKALIASRQLAYIDGLAQCGLTAKDYYTHDGHPNASGYDKIYRCFANRALSILPLRKQ